MAVMSGYTLECAAEAVNRVRLKNPQLEIHTVTIIMWDMSPVLTIVGTNDDMDEITHEEVL